jgi:hypothetical protein
MAAVVGPMFVGSMVNSTLNFLNLAYSVWMSSTANAAKGCLARKLLLKGLGSRVAVGFEQQFGAIRRIGGDNRQPLGFTQWDPPFF